MAFIGLLEVSIAFICYLIFHFFLNKKAHESFPRNWPIVGMLPGLLVMLHRLHEYSAEVLKNSNLTFEFKGPWFAGIDTLVTVDPANINHILSSNFSNYPKGDRFKKIFDILGDGIFNADSELWMDLRKSAQTIFNDPKFQRFSTTTNRHKLQEGLIPLLHQVAEKKMIVDLQDVFQRFTFDATFILVTGYDPEFLSIEKPEIEFANALDDAEEAIIYRHVKPIILWRLQNWFGLGDREKKMRRAQATIDHLCAKFIATKKKEMSKGIHCKGEASDMLTSYLDMDMTKYKLLNPSDDKFLRDTILSFVLAGRDTTSSTLTWFIWLLSKNPEVLTNIRQELNTNPTGTGSPKRQLDYSSHLNKLVYLHGAICETLRLYPPLPFQHKSARKEDVLPSGHRVGANSKILLSLYALGRITSVWGEDALEFKPERWITERGGLKHEPSSKFLSFNSGPRTCLGKEVALAQIKMVAVEIIQNYDIKVVEGQNVEPLLSVLLHMRYGLKVTITKRCMA